MHNSFLENFSYFMMAVAKFLVKIAIFCVVVYFIGMKLFGIGYDLFYEKCMNPDDKSTIVFEIKKNDTVDTISEELKKAGLIDDTNIFKFRAMIYKTKFTPNVYNLDKTMTVKNILDIFDSPTDENLAKISEDVSVYQLSPEGED